MLRYVLYFTIVVITSVLGSCTTNFEYTGTYVAEHNVQNTDTLILKDDNSYERKLYVKESGKLILYQKGEWKVEDDYLILENFFVDLDKEYVPDYNFKNVLINCHFKLQKWDGGISFKYGNFDEEKYTYFKK